MKTKYNHIHFVKQPTLFENHLAYSCRNNKSKCLLGQIYYYPPWRKFVFCPHGPVFFDKSCLRDIIDFLEQLKK